MKIILKMPIFVPYLNFKFQSIYVCRFKICFLKTYMAFSGREMNRYSKCIEDSSFIVIKYLRKAINLPSLKILKFYSKTGRLITLKVTYKNSMFYNKECKHILLIIIYFFNFHLFSLLERRKLNIIEELGQTSSLFNIKN